MGREIRGCIAFGISMQNGVCGSFTVHLARNTLAMCFLIGTSSIFFLLLFLFYFVLFCFFKRTSSFNLYLRRKKKKKEKKKEKKKRVFGFCLGNVGIGGLHLTPTNKIHGHIYHQSLCRDFSL